ncbi:MAG: hypothetical protein WAL25_16260, partial [Acidimicrobiia bacterium]
MLPGGEEATHEKSELGIGDLARYRLPPAREGSVTRGPGSDVFEGVGQAPGDVETGEQGSGGVEVGSVTQTAHP